MATVPAHVAAIAHDHVRLGGSLSALLPALREAFAEDVFRDDRLRLCLRFAVDGPSPFDNPFLIERLAWLAERDAAFLELYGEPYGPAEFMRALQAAGQIRREFKSLLMRAPDDWELVPHPI